MILLSVFFSIEGFSQDSISKKESWDISLIGTMVFGNSERILLINDVNYKWQSTNKKNKLISKNRYVYGTVGSNKKVKENDLRTSIFLILNTDKKWNPMIGFFYQNLQIKKVKSLIKPLFGVQYKLINKNKFVFTPNVLIGYGWQSYKGNTFVNFNNNGANNINGANINLGFNARAKLFNEKLILSMFSIYQIGIEESKHQRLWLDLNIKIPLYKGLYLRTSLNNYYENIVLQGVHKNDANLGYGLGLKF